MNGQAIPGFYYDPEKKKYFKIQNAAASRDLNLEYSAQNFRKKERQERLQNMASAQTDKIRKERVHRRHIGNLTQSSIEREIGFRRRAFYAHHLWPGACMSGVTPKPTKIMDRPSNASIRYFDRDPLSKTVYAVHGDNRIKRRRLHSEEGPPLPQFRWEPNVYLGSTLFNLYTFEPWDELARTTSTVSSLTYLPATGALAATTYGSDRPPIIQLSDPDRDGPFISQQFTPKNCAAIYGAAARPSSFSPSPGLTNSVAASHTEHLAVAASSSMLIFARSQAGAWDSSLAVESLGSDILALDWISYTTIALGSRDGTIRLYDTRSGGASNVLTHPGPISKLRHADDETRLICSGLQDTLFLYDIRAPRFSRSTKSRFNYKDHHNNEDYFIPKLNEVNNSNKRRKTNQKAFKNWSQPVLSFPHANLDDLELSIDVHPRLGLVAAAQDSDTDVAIRVSNIWTGKTVKELRRDLKGSQGPDKIRSLKFIDREDGDGGVDLWTTWNGGIARFGW